MSLETYIFIDGCRFFVGGFKLVHPLSASCFGGLVCAIGSSLSSELPLRSEFHFQLSGFLIAPTSRSPQSTQTITLAKNKPRAAPQSQQRLSDPELTSLMPCLLPISASSDNRTPHGCTDTGFSSLVLVYPVVGRVNCKVILQCSLT